MARHGTLAAHVDRHVPLAEVPAAFAYVATGGKRGLVVVDAGPEERASSTTSSWSRLTR